jgi:hypothetical protein
MDFPKRESEEFEGLAAALALQAEFVAWRRSCALQPTLEDVRRLERWTRLSARHGGVMFAAWAEQI